MEGENAKCKVGVEQQKLISDAKEEQIPKTINGKSEPWYESWNCNLKYSVYTAMDNYTRIATIKL